MTPLILNIEPDRFSRAARDILVGCGVLKETAPSSRPDLLRRVREADVLWTRLAHRIDRELLEAGERLRVVVTPTTGLNHIDLEAAGHRGVAVLSLRGETTFLEGITPTAELAWGLILCLVRRLPEAFSHVREGGWNRDLLRGNELQGRTLGLIGIGRLGRMVAAFGTAFHMKVLAYDPAPARSAPEEVELMSFDRVLEEADVVSVHAAFAEHSRGLIGEKAFARMKPGALFVNTARGEIVDEAALLDALHSGRVAAAALDVLAGEPFADGLPSDHPLVRFARAHPDRLLLTPHIGGATVESMAATEVFMAEKLRNWLEANPVIASKEES